MLEKGDNSAEIKIGGEEHMLTGDCYGEAKQDREI